MIYARSTHCQSNAWLSAASISAYAPVSALRYGTDDSFHRYSFGNHTSSGRRS